MMENKLLKVLFFSLFLFSSVTLFSQSFIGSDITRNEAPIVLGFTKFEPVSYLDETGQLTGFYYELVTSILDSLNIDYIVEYNEDFPLIYNEIMNGDIDMFSSLIRSFSREDTIYWPRYSISTSYSALYVNQNDGFDNISEIAGKKIGFVRNEASLSEFERLMNDFNISFSYSYYNSFSEMIEALSNEEIFGFVASSLLDISEFSSNVYETTFVFSPLNSYVTGSLSHVEENEYIKNVIDLISYEIYELKEDRNSIYWKLYEKYYKTEVVSKIPPWIISGILVLFLTVLLSIVIINLLTRKLRKSNSELVDLNEHLEDKVKIAAEEIMIIENQASIGRLTASLAHEINTPIGVAYTSSTFHQSKIEQFQEKYEKGKITEKDFIEFLEHSKEAMNLLNFNLHRAAELVQNLKNLSADQFSADSGKTFYLPEYAESIFDTIYVKYKKEKKVVLITNIDKLEIRNGNPTVFYQILSNLIVNSFEHGFEGKAQGIITLNLILDEKHKKFVFCYMDDGRGIPEDIIDKIWEPFFTTKRISGNTGLGMSTVYNLARKTYEAKDVYIRNRIDNGIEFGFEMPITEDMKLTKEKDRVIIE